MFFYSADRSGQHPRRHLADYAGILQADAYAGYNELYLPARKPGPITEAACWSHGRRKHFELAKLTKAGFEVGGERLKTTPRGYDAAHPRIDPSPSRPARSNLGLVAPKPPN